MKHVCLAKAISHYLEYERLCGRSNLLSEAVLKAPIGEFLLSTQGHSVEVEVPYPDYMQPPRGRPRSVDFCLQRTGGNHVWTNIVESKWATSRRDQSQEIFDDLLRLEVVRQANQAPFERLFLLAGEATIINQNIFERQANTGEPEGRVPLFAGVLPRTGNTQCQVFGAAAGIVEYWRRAAGAIGLTSLPLTMKVERVAHAKAGVYSCWVWRVSSVQNRSAHNFLP